MITPYNAQVRLLSDLFREQGWLEQMSEVGGAWDVGGVGGIGGGGGAGGERSERYEGVNSRISPRSVGSAVSGSRYQGDGGRGEGSRAVDGGRGGRGGGRGGGGGREGDRSRGMEGEERERASRDRRSGNREASRNNAPSTIGWVGGRGTFKVPAPADGAAGYSRYDGKGKSKSKGENGGGSTAGSGGGVRRESEADVLSSFSRIKGVKGVSNKQLSNMAAKVRTYIYHLQHVLC